VEKAWAGQIAGLLSCGVASGRILIWSSPSVH
jgi:hypothetical protein